MAEAARERATTLTATIRPAAAPPAAASSSFAPTRLSGTATLTANGSSAYNGTANDAGGGGGAGGTIVVLSANGGESGLTLQANGGSGGDAWASEPFSLGNRHGPGGGGGGGVVLVSGTPASISVSGGTNGLTENPGVAYGSTPGAAGTSVTNASIYIDLRYAVGRTMHPRHDAHQEPCSGLRLLAAQLPLTPSLSRT